MKKEQDSKKKFLIIYENELYGGTTTHLINFLNSDQFKQHDITILTNFGNEAINDLKRNCKRKNIKYLYFRSPRVFLSKNLLLKIIFLITKPFLFLISIYQFYKILNKVDYYILLANCGGYGDFRSEIACVLASALKGVKQNFLLIHHSYTNPRLWKFLIKLFDQLSISFLKKIIFVSKATKKTIIKNSGFSKIESNKLAVIYNGVEVKNINTQSRKTRGKKKIIKILMLSRIEKYKGQQDLLLSLEYLKKKYVDKIKIYLIGNGDKKYMRKLKKYILQKNLEKKIIFKNYLPKKKSSEIFKNYDLFLSLTRDFEGFGYSLVEAMLSNIPVITTNVGGAKEFLNNKIANIVKPSDPRAISQMIVNFINNREKWKKKSFFAAKFIKKNFNSEIMSIKYKKLFNI